MAHIMELTFLSFQEERRNAELRSVSDRLQCVEAALQARVSWVFKSLCMEIRAPAKSKTQNSVKSESPITQLWSFLILICSGEKHRGLPGQTRCSQPIATKGIFLFLPKCTFWLHSRLSSSSESFSNLKNRRIYPDHVSCIMYHCRIYPDQRNFSTPRRKKEHTGESEGISMRFKEHTSESEGIANLAKRLSKRMLRSNCTVDALSWEGEGG